MFLVQPYLLFQVIEVLAEKRLSSSLAHLYGPALTCQVSMVQSLLRIAIAASFSAIPTDTTKMQLVFILPFSPDQNFNFLNPSVFLVGALRRKRRL